MTATASAPRAPANGSRRASPATVARRRQRNVPLGVLGVVIVLGSALGGLLWSRSTTSTTEVLVAANDIPAGRTLADTDLRVVRLSTQDPVASIAANERTSVVGQAAAVPIPAGAVLARSEIGRAGIDVRGDGGYVLAPPSLHVCGLRYEAIDIDAPIAPMPSWMAELATPPPRVEPTDRAAPFVQDGSAWARAALDSEVRSVARAEMGTRNATLNRAAFSLGQIVAGGGLNNATVERALLDAAMAVGLSDREARATIASGLGAGAKQPRTPPQRDRDPVRPTRSTSPDAAPQTVTFVPWPKDFDGPSFGARSDYVEQCWTSVLGPTSIMALRAIAKQLESAGGPAHIDLEQLGRTLGVGASGGRHSVLQRTLGRLEQFGAAIALPDGSMAVRTELPPLRANQLRRASPTVQHWHQQLCPDRTPTCTLSR